MLCTYDLASILDPVTPAVFFADHYERAPLVLHRERPEAFRGLLSLEVIDALLAGRQMHVPGVSVVDNTRKIAVDEYSFPSGLIDVVRAHQLFAAGSTLVFGQLETEHPPLHSLVRALERDICTRFQANIYLTPANAQGFKPHYDSHDVFVLQCEGRKRWMLYDAPVVLPYRRQEFDPATTPCGPVSQEFDMEPGDVMYIPRGLMHDARTAGTHSLHITVGLLFTSWTDLMVEGLSRVGLGDPEFRKSLPPGFARTGFDRSAAREHLATLLKRFAEGVDLDALLEHFQQDLVSTRDARLPGQFAQLSALDATTADTVFSPRPDLVWSLSVEGDTVGLSIYGHRVSFPAYVSDALEWALTHAGYTARELPGDLDEAGRMVLLRRLVREGVLMAATSALDLAHP